MDIPKWKIKMWEREERRVRITPTETFPTGQAILKDAADEIEKFREAVRPFYACVFDDNGELLIDQSRLTVADWVKLKNCFRDAKYSNQQ